MRQNPYNESDSMLHSCETSYEPTEAYTGSAKTPYDLNAEAEELGRMAVCPKNSVLLTLDTPEAASDIPAQKSSIELEITQVQSSTQTPATFDSVIEVEVPAQRGALSADLNDKSSNGSKEKYLRSTAESDEESATEKKTTRKNKKARSIPTIQSNGVLYTADQTWRRTLSRVKYCHILVSLDSIDTSKHISPDKIATRDKEKSTETSTTAASIEPSLMAMPVRLSIINDLLVSEITQMCPPQLPLRNNMVNHDHAAPFRTIISLEEDIRERHKDLEAEFDQMRRDCPSHRSVIRTTNWVPRHLRYSPSESRDSDDETNEYSSDSDEDSYNLDNIDKTRILLDGFRALMHLFDTNLKRLVEDYRSIKSGVADKLPFEHLWFAFEPGQEIVSWQPKPQLYRVLQVTGGRKSLVPRSEGKLSQRTVSDLVIDCFYIDFDGKRFGPVPFKIAIKPYNGLKSISELSAYPVRFDDHRKRGDIVPLADLLAARGKKFEGLVSVSHRIYKGFSLREEQGFETYEDVSQLLSLQGASLTHIPNRLTVKS